MKTHVILMAEMDEILCQKLTRYFRNHFYKVITTSGNSNTLHFFQNMAPDLIIIGASGKGEMSGIDLVNRIRQQNKRIPIIIITRHSSEDRIIACLRAGVNDYFKMPFSVNDLTKSIKRILSDNKTDISKDQAQFSDFMIGESTIMKEIKDYIKKVARSDSNVLITGETGTGKELTAKLIHNTSLRQGKPFVCINCAALPENLIESELFGYERGAFTGAYSSYSGKLKIADGGDVFFDEIGEMSPYAQAKILRVIEDKKFYHVGGKKSISLDIRFIAATNQNLEQLLIEKKFRKDLYYRLNVACIHMPSLRERKEDIPYLLEHSIRELNRYFGRDVEGFTDNALELLIQYNWPGNIREMRNLLEATFINLCSSRISLIDLPKRFQKKLIESEGLPKNERDLMLSALFSTRWNKSKAAKKLHWSRMTLYRKMTQYNIITQA